MDDDKGSAASSSPLVRQVNRYNHLDVPPRPKQSGAATGTAEKLWQVIITRFFIAIISCISTVVCRANKEMDSKL